MIVFGLGKNLLFKSVLGHCAWAWKSHFLAKSVGDLIHFVQIHIYVLQVLRDQWIKLIYTVFSSFFVLMNETNYWVKQLQSVIQVIPKENWFKKNFMLFWQKKSFWKVEIAFFSYVSHSPVIFMVFWIRNSVNKLDFLTPQAL